MGQGVRANPSVYAESGPMLVVFFSLFGMFCFHNLINKDQTKYYAPTNSWSSDNIDRYFQFPKRHLTTVNGLP